MKRARRIPPSIIQKAVSRQRYSVADLLLQMPEGAPVNAEQEALAPVGQEIKPVLAMLRTIRLMKRFMRKQQRKQAARGIELRRLIDEGRA